MYHPLLGRCSFITISIIVTVSITVTPVNDTPTNTVPSARTVIVTRGSPLALQQTHDAAARHDAAGLRTLVLNFASPIVAGGGFLARSWDERCTRVHSH